LNILQPIFLLILISVHPFKFQAISVGKLKELTERLRDLPFFRFSPNVENRSLIDFASHSVTVQGQGILAKNGADFVKRS